MSSTGHSTEVEQVRSFTIHMQEDKEKTKHYIWDILGIPEARLMVKAKQMTDTLSKRRKSSCQERMIPN